MVNVVTQFKPRDSICSYFGDIVVVNIILEANLKELYAKIDLPLLSGLSPYRGIVFSIKLV